MSSTTTAAALVAVTAAATTVTTATADERPHAVAWTWLLRLSAVVTVAPLYAAKFLPFADLPEHVAVIGTLAGWSRPELRFREHFALAFGDTQYVAYHLVGALLAPLAGGAEQANRLLLVAAGVSVPYAARELLRARRCDERLALLAAPLFWTRALLIGFLPYVASVPLVLYALAVTVRQLEAPSPRRAVGLAALVVALYYVHVDAFVLYLTIAAALGVALPDDRPPDGRELVARVLSLPRRMVWLAPSVALAAFWALRGDVTMYGGPLGKEIWYVPVKWTLHDFPLWAHDVWRSHADEWTAVAYWLIVVWLAVQRGPRTHWYRAVVGWIPFACALVAFLALPFQIGAGSFLNVRLAGFLVLFVPLALAPGRGRSADLAFAAVFVVTLAVSATAAVEIRRANRDLGDFDRVLAAVPRGARLLSLVFRPVSAQTHWTAWIHEGSLHRARDGGVAEHSFSRLRHWPVHYRPDAAPPAHAHPFWEFDPCSFRNAVDGPYYDYVLTRGSVAVFADAPPGPAWTPILRESDWMLYERRPGASNEPWEGIVGATLEDPGPCGSRVLVERASAR